MCLEFIILYKSENYGKVSLATELLEENSYHLYVYCTGWNFSLLCAVVERLKLIMEEIEGAINIFKEEQKQK